MVAGHRVVLTKEFDRRLDAVLPIDLSTRHQVLLLRQLGLLLCSLSLLALGARHSR